MNGNVSRPTRALTARERGRGLLRALVFEDPVAEELSERAREEGVLLNAARPHVLRFMPQLRVSAAEIRQMAERLTRAYASAARALVEQPPDGPAVARRR